MTFLFNKYFFLQMSHELLSQGRTLSRTLKQKIIITIII